MEDLVPVEKPVQPPPKGKKQLMSTCFLRKGLLSLTNWERYWGISIPFVPMLSIWSLRWKYDLLVENV